MKGFPVSVIAVSFTFLVACSRLREPDVDLDRANPSVETNAAEVVGLYWTGGANYVALLPSGRWFDVERHGIGGGTVNLWATGHWTRVSNGIVRVEGIHASRPDSTMVVTLRPVILGRQVTLTPDSFYMLPWQKIVGAHTGTGTGCVNEAVCVSLQAAHSRESGDWEEAAMILTDELLTAARSVPSQMRAIQEFLWHAGTMNEDEGWSALEQLIYSMSLDEYMSICRQLSKKTSGEGARPDQGAP